MIDAEKKQQVKKAGKEAKPWVRRLGRFGIITRGSVYLLVGILTMMAAAGIGGHTKGTEGAFASVAAQPFGAVLLWIVGFGLIWYAIWRMIETFIDPENKGTGIKGIISRVGYVISFIIHIGLAFQAFSFARHAGQSGDAPKTWTAKLLSQPFGPWMVGLIGFIIIGYGIYEIHKGYTERFVKRFHTEDMHPEELQIGKKAGKIGLAVRGLILCMVGYFFLQTAITFDPNKVIGLDEALSKLSQQPFGQGILGLTAFGLTLYGVFEIIKGKYQHMGLGDY